MGSGIAHPIMQIDIFDDCECAFGFDKRSIIFFHQCIWILHEKNDMFLDFSCHRETLSFSGKVWVANELMLSMNYDNYETCSLREKSVCRNKKKQSNS